MKPAPFTYHDPATLDEAVALLGRLENARALAGGQSLMPMMNFRFVMPDHIVDLNAIEDLAAIRVEAERILFGAMTRQRAIERSAEVQAACPIITEALAHVGHRQTRNRGTIGGSLCHLDPAAELANLACLHDAVLTARSRMRSRTLPFTEFAQGYLTNALTDGELLTAIEFKRWPSRHGYGFEEIARRRGDFAMAIVSALVLLDVEGRIERAAVCVSAVEAVPVRLTAVESMLVGQVPTPDLYRAAGIEAEKLDAMEDAYVSARYRKHLARVLVFRALEKAVASARKRGDADA
jgi:carbon-monoxide dehydrogenase medium subunit